MCGSTYSFSVLAKRVTYKQFTCVSNTQVWVLLPVLCTGSGIPWLPSSPLPLQYTSSTSISNKHSLISCLCFMSDEALWYLQAGKLCDLLFRFIRFAAGEQNEVQEERLEKTEDIWCFYCLKRDKSHWQNLHNNICSKDRKWHMMEFRASVESK